MPEQPLISIITVNLNDLEGFKRTMTSVFEQSWQEFEYIVIDGGSTDGSKEYIKSHSAKIDYWVSEQDKGIYNAMNKGIKAAKGEYLLFLNSGDWLCNNQVIKVIYKELLGIDFVYGNIIRIFKYGREIIEKGTEQVTLKTFFQKSLNHQALFIHKRIFKIYGLYDENLKIVADWKLNLIALGLNDSKIKYIDLDISFYDMEGLSMNFQLRDLERKKVFEELIPRPIYYDYNEFLKPKNSYKSNRFKMFLELEDHKITRKINSILFRILLALFTKKRLKDLLPFL